MHDPVYGVVAPRRIVEPSFRRGRPAGCSDLRLDADGSSFVERHVGADGGAVRVVFLRARPPGASAPPGTTTGATMFQGRRPTVFTARLRGA